MSILKSFSLFTDLSADDLKLVAESMTKQRYDSKEVIFLEEDKAEAIFFILEGAIRIFKSDSYGKEVTLAILFRGDFFGETGIITGDNRTAGAEALEPSLLMRLQRDEFIKILKNNGALTFKLLQEVSLRLTQTNAQLEGLVSRDLQGRVKESLQRYQGLRLTHQEIANIVGASRESVSRALCKLQESGEIEYTNKIFTVRSDPSDPDHRK